MKYTADKPTREISEVSGSEAKNRLYFVKPAGKRVDSFTFYEICSSLMQNGCIENVATHFLPVRYEIFGRLIKFHNPM